MKPIYLDHAATTPVHPEVIDVMTQIYKENFGNPSSIHQFGRKARHSIDEARALIAKSIGARPREIIFTSGGTESDNMAIIGTAEANQHKGKHIITTAIEHHAILNTCKNLEQQGFDVTYLKVDDQGLINIDELEKSIREDTILVTIMYGNNEMGTIQPIDKIAQLCQEQDIPFHTDAVQAFGTVRIDVSKTPISMASLTAHKINGPKGIGCLYVREGTHLASQSFGGEQERKRRAGTENVPGIVGFQKAIEITQNTRDTRCHHYKNLRQVLLQELDAEEVTYEINGHPEAHLLNIINIYFPGTNVETLLVNLDLAGVAVSSGSACTAGSIDPSHVLAAMFKSNSDRAKSSIRISFGLYNDVDNVKQAANVIAKTVKRLAK